MLLRASSVFLLSPLISLGMALGLAPWSACGIEQLQAVLQSLWVMPSLSPYDKAPLRTITMIAIDHKDKNKAMAMWIPLGLQSMHLPDFVLPWVSSQAPQNIPWYPWQHAYASVECLPFEPDTFLDESNEYDKIDDKILATTKFVTYQHAWCRTCL